MTIERPMFPPRRENPFHLVGGTDANNAPYSGMPIKTAEIDHEQFGPQRSQKDVARAIEGFQDARAAYARAVSWIAAAEAEHLPQANIEAAQQDASQLHAEMENAAKQLILCMPHDLKALIDLTLYLENNFTSLPAEIFVSGGSRNGLPKTQSLAFYLLRTMRLSLRAVAKYGKH